jgi:hypothetical protein
MTPASWTREPGQIEAEVLMHRQVHPGSFLIIEGPEDYRFWERRVARSPSCELVIGGGKSAVEEAVIRLDRRRFDGALGIVDDDLDRLFGRKLPSNNLLATDAHDLECLLLRSPALDGVLAEYADSARIQRFERSEGTTLRSALLARGLPFGRLRWLARRVAWTGAFDALRPSPRFIEERTWRVDQEALYDAAVAVGLCSSRAVLLDALAALPDSDPWSVCQGHDLIEILKFGLRRVLGDLKSSKGAADIAALLRQSFDQRDFEQSGLGPAIHCWEETNPPYLVLPMPLVPQPAEAT